MNGNGESPNTERSLREIAIVVAGDSVTAVLKCPGSGDRTATCILDLEARRKESINLLTKLLRKAMDEGRRDSLESDLYRDLLQALGRELFDLLLRGNVGELVRGELRAVGLGQSRLRLNLLFTGEHVSWLSALPWEYIHTPHGDESLGEAGDFLSSQTELILSRRLGRASRDLGQDLRPIKVLFVCASPTTPDGEDDPLRKVTPGSMLQTLDELEQAGFIQLLRLIDEDPPSHTEVSPGYVWKATSARFAKMVKTEDPVLIHFVGHGRHLNGAGQLAFSTRNGKPEWVNDDWFAARATDQSGLKAVLLQACESAMSDPYVAFSGVALRLANKGVPAVIGMQYRVKANIAETFASAVYRALADDDSIDMAVKAGRAALTADQKAWTEACFGLPVLYLSQYEGIARRRTVRQRPLHKALSVGGGPSRSQWHGTCPACGAVFSPGDNYDPNCGAPLPAYCRVCGHTQEGPQPRFCPSCGEQTKPSFQDTVIEPEVDAFESEFGTFESQFAAALRGPGPSP